MNRQSKHKAAALLAGLMLAGLAGCAGAPSASSTAPGSTPTAAPAADTPDTAAEPFMAVEDFPSLDGSTACLPLMAQLYATACGLSLADAETMVTASRTDTAWGSLVNGGADLLLVYIPSVQAQTARDTGEVKTEQTAIGRDALVFLKNSENPVENLTAGQLRGIYTGEITNWSALGGPDAVIAPFQRNADSGSQTLFLKLLMEGEPPMTPPTELVSGSMGALLESVAGYDNGPGAIGYSVYYYAAKMMATPGISLLKVDGVAPADTSIADGSYPLVENFYAAIRADEPAHSPARTLYDWLQTDAGKQLIRDAGYVTAE